LNTQKLHKIHLQSWCTPDMKSCWMSQACPSRNLGINILSTIGKPCCDDVHTLFDLVSLIIRCLCFLFGNALLVSQSGLLSCTWIVGTFFSNCQTRVFNECFTIIDGIIWSKTGCSIHILSCSSERQNIIATNMFACCHECMAKLLSFPNFHCQHHFNIFIISCR
jgi:hypothetical protein